MALLVKFSKIALLRGKGEGFTGIIDLGRIDNQTKPVNKLVTAKPSANRSALDCELQITRLITL